MNIFTKLSNLLKTPQTPESELRSSLNCELKLLKTTGKDVGLTVNVFQNLSYSMKKVDAKFYNNDVLQKLEECTKSGNETDIARLSEYLKTYLRWLLKSKDSLLKS